MPKDSLVFCGANINGLSIKQTKLKELDFAYSKLSGGTEISGKIRRLNVKFSNIYSSFKICNSRNIKFIYIQHSKFLHVLGCITSSEDFQICNANINIFRMENCLSEMTLAFQGSSFNVFEIRNNQLHTCPSFFNFKSIGSNSRILLPSYKDFLFDKTKTKNGRFQENEYHKFREVYKITQSYNLCEEQNEYYYFMMRAHEKSRPFFNITNILSKFYRISSNYGQSILRPFFGLAATLLLFGFLYFIFDEQKISGILNNINHYLLMSLRQIVSPFQLVNSESIGYLNRICRVFSFFETILSSTFIGFIFLGLRWNFKRN